MLAPRPSTFHSGSISAESVVMLKSDSAASFLPDVSIILFIRLILFHFVSRCNTCFGLLNCENVYTNKRYFLFFFLSFGHNCRVQCEFIAVEWHTDNSNIFLLLGIRNSYPKCQKKKTEKKKNSIMSSFIWHNAFVSIDIYVFSCERIQSSVVCHRLLHVQCTCKCHPLLFHLIWFYSLFSFFFSLRTAQ